jgi:hypothetical protein
MMTQTTLSAATSASPEPRRAALREWGFAPFARNLETCRDAGSVARTLLPMCCCYAECEEPPYTAASLKPQILIANPELEFELTHRKISPLRISNGKYSGVLRLLRRISIFRPGAISREFLIYGSAIKSRRKPFENSNLQISNRR